MDDSKGMYLPGRIRATKEAPFGVESKGHRSEAAVGTFREVRSLGDELVAGCRLAPSYGQPAIPWNAVRSNGKNQVAKGLIR